MTYILLILLYGTTVNAVSASSVISQQQWLFVRALTNWRWWWWWMDKVTNAM